MNFEEYPMNGRITITMPKDEADALQKRIAEGLEPDMELMDGTLIKKADIRIKYNTE